MKRMDHRSDDEREAFVDLGIDGYEKAVEIGRGGFSVVYRAWEPAFERHVAVKVVSTDLRSTEVDRFGRECAAIGRLAGHPNIVTVHKAGRLRSGQPFIAMEFLGGGSLAESMTKGPMGWVAAMDIGVKLAGALESAHRAGVLHRDVKPGNVMLSRYGDCKLGDFGIARMEGGSETQSGVVVASWAHAPPEVVGGGRPSAVSDVYSLASTLFTLIDGRSPFGLDRPESTLALMASIVRDPVRPLRGDVPEPVERVIREGLAKDPADRPASAAAFGCRLQAAQAALHVPVTAMPVAVEDSTGAETPVTEYVDLPPLPPTTDADPLPRATVVTAAPRRRNGWTWTAGAAIMAVAAAALLVVNPGGGMDENRTAASTTLLTTTTSAAASTSSGGPATTAATATTRPPAAGQGVRLGQDLVPVSNEPCRTPTTASGSAWQLAPTQLGGRAFEVGYYCNLFAGGVGSLDFVLGGTYKLLTTSIGFADGSTSTSHMVRYEIIGDGRENLLEPTALKFGDVRNLQVDVSGVTRLKIRITELSAPGGSEGASRPVLAAPTLTRS
jgi:hypothetical protein